MKIIIVGCGKVGFSLAKQLSQENHDITIIDSSTKVIEKVQESIDVIAVSGNGAALDIQKEANVEDADLLIAMTSSDEVNLLCCIVAKRLGCHNTIPRVRNADYVKQIQLMRGDFGISMTVNPEFSTARTIFRFLQFPSFLKTDSFAKGRVELVELKINDGDILDGKSLDKLSSELHLRVLVCVVERGDNIFIPGGSATFRAVDKLRAGDKINVTAPRSELAKMIKKTGIEAQKIHNVMIIGGGISAEYLIEELLHSGVDVKIIEINRERCVELATRFPDALIINEDGSNQEVLLAEGIRETDAVVTMTGMDEQNLVISMYAEHIGVPKTVTKMNRSEYSKLFSDKELGSTVCAKDIVTSDIIRYVRSMSGTSGSMVTLHKLVDGKAEAIEFNASAGTKGLGIPLKDIKLKKNILIACINHNGNIIIPGANDSFSIGDTVIIVAKADEPIYELNDIFENIEQ